ncbi:dachshund homolog 1-like isoform X2 [Centruroides sculpturatus]|uniref:dachshund homolog 1-like isoform X2 n=1 Tax=Centruroides sculpturatus TaxID=218467 RepID=UPI000C6C9196|nr:dachshund homolog 1-like isoform X2 [Centruroides sculpturatus]
MDGSSGEGTISPSGDLSSPQSLQTSPNPDSSGLPGDSGQILAGSSPKPVTSMAGLQGAGSQVIGANRSSPVGSPGSAVPAVSVAKSYAPGIVSAGALSACGPKHPLEPLPLGLTAPRPGGPSQVNSYGLHGGRIHTASPPGLTTDATANDCRLIDYRGAKVAAFLVNGEYLLCLPQAFELFLKHLVGGLHTVYTKLKRLDITPIVCNVEQVRILRGLGAIQPGVNRCKLLSCKDFDSLYKDCTTARLREERSDVAETKDRLYGFDSHRMKDPSFLNGASANGHSPVLNLSQNSSRGGLGAGGGTSNGGGDHSGSDTAYNDGPDDDDNDSEDDDEDDREQDLSDNPDVSSTANTDRLSSQQLPFPNVVGDSGTVSGQGSSSIETLLRNIQGLLKVAADNARQQERQINLEKAELKMEIMRERELRENMEKQLLEEQRTRILFQKRLKKEKRSRRRVQDQLESEMKKRSQYEDALRTSSAETLRLLNESLAQELERERASRPENEHKMQDCPMSV